MPDLVADLTSPPESRAESLQYHSLLAHCQGGKPEHGANLESLELFANEVMPEFVADEDRREAEKAEQLAPAIEAGCQKRQGPGAPANGSTLSPVSIPWATTPS
jgi:hypothetical protein